MLTMLCRLARSIIHSLSYTILIICACSTFALSQELKKQEPSKSTDTKQNASTYNRGTKDVPVFVEIGPSAPLKVETERDEEAEKEKTLNEGRIANGTIAIAVFTCILACATIGLMIFTANLWKSTNRLVVSAELIAKRQLRAYVSIENAQITGLGDGQVPTATLLIKNAGQTPAYKLRGKGGIAKGTSWEALTPGPDGPLELTQSSLGPGCTTYQFHPAPRQLHPGEMDTLLDGSHTIFVYGEMNYIDVFDEPHLIEYRFQVGGSMGIRGNHLAISPEGNRET